MNFRGRPIEKEEDLQWLVDNQAQEGLDIEYKRDLYSTNDGGRRELLRDVVSMANASGGIILIGLEEDSDGFPKRITGVERGNYSEPITSSCLANIDRRISGLECKEIDLAKGCQVVAIGIPRSLNAPHMVTFKGLNQFWKRHGRQKAPMTVDEIQANIEGNVAGAKNLEDFVSQRMQFHEQQLAQQQPWLVFVASPIFRREISIDIRESSPARRILGAYAGTAWMGSIRPSLYGLEGRSVAGTGRERRSRFLQLHRDGFFEWGESASHPSCHEFIPAKSVKERIESLVKLVADVWTQTGAVPLFFAQMAILNAAGHRLGVSEGLAELDVPPQGELWKESRHLLLAGLGANSIEELRVLPREVNDRLWQAFHYENCAYYH